MCHCFSFGNTLGGLNWIAYDPELREELSITDGQLSEIRQVLSDKKLFVGDAAANDAVGKTYLKKILTKEQASLLRIEVVTTRIGTPASLFSPSFLSELRLESEEVLRIHYAFSEKHLKISEELDNLRIAAIKNSIPPDALSVLWKFVGKEFRVEENGEDVEFVAEFAGQTPLLQISEASYVALQPASLRVSAEKREQLRVIRQEVHRKLAHGIVCSREELEQELDAILTKSQRFAMIQTMNQQVLRSDLLVILNPKAVKHYGLSDEVLLGVRAKLSESKKIIEETEMALLTQACSELLKLEDIPLHVKTEIRELAAGVWAL